MFVGRIRLGATLALASFGLMLAFAPPALAHSSYSGLCDGCHSGSAPEPSVTLASIGGGMATYNAGAPGAYAIAVFDGSSKVFAADASASSFTVAVGKTYTVYVVMGLTRQSGIASVTLTPAAPPPADTSAPQTVSDAKTSYVGMAAIKLSATDEGSGVSSTYFKLDGGPQTAGTTIAVSTLGTHTIEFWSVDAAGNTEAHKSATFTVTAPVPPRTVPPAPVDVTPPVTTCDATSSYSVSAAIKLSATDKGSGVAATWYQLDDAAPATGTAVAVSTVGTHTLEFWSVDVAGNAEAHQFARFSVLAPPSDPATTTLTISARTYRFHGCRFVVLSGTVSPAPHGAAVRLYVQRPGSSTWSGIAKLWARRTPHAGEWRRGAKASDTATWVCAYPLARKGAYQFQARLGGTGSVPAAVSATITVDGR